MHTRKHFLFCLVFIVLLALYVTHNREKSKLCCFWIYSVYDFPLIFLLALCMLFEFLSHNSYNVLLIVMEHSYLMLLSSSHKMPTDVIDITLNNWCDVYHFLVYTHSTMQNIKIDYSLWKLPFEILTLSSEVPHCLLCSGISRDDHKPKTADAVVKAFNTA